MLSVWHMGIAKTRRKFQMSFSEILFLFNFQITMISIIYPEIIDEIIIH